MINIDLIIIICLHNANSLAFVDGSLQHIYLCVIMLLLLSSISFLDTTSTMASIKINLSLFSAIRLSFIEYIFNGEFVISLIVKL